MAEVGNNYPIRHGEEVDKVAASAVDFRGIGVGSGWEHGCK